MKTILLKTQLKRVHVRARAVHRLARQKRWPAYVFVAAVQDPLIVPHDVHDNVPATVALRALHMYLVYLSLTLIE